MNMKYFKLKFIIPTLLIIVLGVALLMFFVGALKPYEITNDNIPFDLTGFKDYSTLKDEEYKALSTSTLVADNDKYCMVINEKTTIVAVYEKGENWSSVEPTKNAELVYSSSSSTGDQSNLELSYYTTAYKPGVYNSYKYSVNYKNRLTGLFEHHYQIRFNPSSEESNASVDVLYQIGDFLNINKLFPSKIERYAFEDLFVGNMMLRHDDMTKSIVTVDEGTDNEFKAPAIVYTGNAVTWSDECANYLIERGASLDIEGVTLEEYKQTTKYKTNGYIELTNLKDENGKLKVNFNDGINSEGSPCESNPFLNFNTISVALKSMYELVTGDEKNKDAEEKYNTDILYHGENASPTLNFISAGDVNDKRTNRILYAQPQGEDDKSYYYYTQSLTYSNVPVHYDYNGDGKYTSDEKLLWGGYQAREVDEDGNKTWLYDENGMPVQMGINQEFVDEQNAQYGNSDIAGTSVFQVCLRFELTDNGFKCYALNNSIREGEGNDAEDFYFKHDYVISSLTILPEFTQNDGDVKKINNVDTPTSVGQIVLPDGSGSIISFNSDKSIQQVSSYSEKRIYGSDRTIPQAERGNYSQDLMLPLYGFIEQSDNKGVVAIAEKGAGQTAIAADFYRSESKTPNYAKFITYYRETEKVKNAGNKEYIKLSKNLYSQDICYNYVFLSGEDLDYVDVANVYRSYLLEKYEFAGDKTTSNVVSLNFLGAFTKKQIALGFVYDSEKSLTTFKQAGEIVKDLYSNGVKTMNVAYTNWTEDEGEPEITTDLSVSSALGGKKELKELTEELKELNIKLFADYNVTSGFGYDFSFGTLKYNTRSVSSSYSSAAEYVLSTGLEDSSRRSGNIISPRFYNALISKYSEKVEKYGIDGLSLYDLGNDRIADYNKNNTIYSEDAIAYQVDAIKVASKNLNGNVLLTTPFDYAVPYASYANNVPTTTTLYPIVDHAIPLYQLVFSGFVDYSSELVNYNNDYTVDYNILKAIETGSNLSFLLSYENTNVLLDTHYTEFYNAYYLNWRKNIISMTNTLNELGIYEGYLVDHKYVTDNVVQVKYSNGLTILINYDNNIYQDPSTGLAVASNWFTVVEEGGSNE